MIWIDLDGVLVDFNKAACQTLGIAYPQQTVLHRDWLNDQFPDLSLTKLFDRLHENPRFWQDMPPTDLCSHMVAFLDEYVSDWGIMTSAWRHPACYAGKYEWVSKNLGRKAVGRMVIVSGTKERLTSPTAHLTDDTRANVDKWINAGGKAFHWVEYSQDMQSALAVQFQNWKAEIFYHQRTHK